ncbi:MAG: universal stress protein, partial [Candidatus Thermoplasmatota archaeon]|nr:universal stress protein [Candidatus Thermoplasmatota archaeon]
MFGKLLLPLDPSKRLKAATDYALTLARRLEQPLVAAYIANPTKIGAGSGMRDPKECFYPLGDRELKRFAASVTDVAVEPLLRCGERPQVLSHMVTEEQVGDTLVLGPFRSRLTRFFTGSEVERILEDVQCHAFVIREEQPLPGPGAPALVAFDGPQLPDAALELIELLAQSFGCDLELLHLGEDIHGGAAALDEAVQELRGKLGGEF